MKFSRLLLAISCACMTVLLTISPAFAAEGASSDYSSQLAEISSKLDLIHSDLTALNSTLVDADGKGLYDDDFASLSTDVKSVSTAIESLEFPAVPDYSSDLETLNADINANNASVVDAIHASSPNAATQAEDYSYILAFLCFALGFGPALTSGLIFARSLGGGAL